MSNTIPFKSATMSSAESHDFILKLAALKPNQGLHRSTMGYEIVGLKDPKAVTLDQIVVIARNCLGAIDADYKRDKEFNEKHDHCRFNDAFVLQSYNEKRRDLHDGLTSFGAQFIEDHRSLPTLLPLLKLGRILIDLHRSLYRRELGQVETKADVENASRQLPKRIVRKTELISRPFRLELIKPEEIKALNAIFLNHQKFVKFYCFYMQELYEGGHPHFRVKDMSGRIEEIRRENPDEAALIQASEESILQSVTQIADAIFSKGERSWFDQLEAEVIRSAETLLDTLKLPELVTNEINVYLETSNALRQFYGKVIEFSPNLVVAELEGSNSAAALRSYFLDLEVFKETRPAKDHELIMHTMQNFLFAAGLHLREHIVGDKDKLHQAHLDVMRQCETLPPFVDNGVRQKYVLVPIRYMCPREDASQVGHIALAMIARDTPEKYSFTIVNTGEESPRVTSTHTCELVYDLLSLDKISECLMALYPFTLPDKKHSMKLVTDTIDQHLKKFLGYNRRYGRPYAIQNKGTCGFASSLRVLHMTFPIQLFRDFLLFMMRRTIKKTHEALKGLGQKRNAVVQAILKKDIAKEAEETIDRLFDAANEVEDAFKQAVLECKREEAFPAPSKMTQKHVEKTLMLFESRF